MQNEEHILQVAICEYLDYRNIGYFAVPNGGLRNVAVAAKLKREGVKAGVADLFIMQANKSYHGLFVEVKVGKNPQTPSQKIFEARAKLKKYEYILVRSFDELVNALNQYINDK